MTARTTGLVAILRGLTPHEAPDIGRRLYAAGFRALEVPLNSPDPLASIRSLRDLLPEDCAVGAGTVLTVEEVGAVHAAGADLVVSPAMDAEVIAATVGLGMASCPGVVTPTEAFGALRAGARTLKLFPADAVGTTGLRAWRAVLPDDVAVLPVGGVDAENLGEWVSAGAAGAGIGSWLYRPGVDPEVLSTRADALVGAWRTANHHRSG